MELRDYLSTMSEALPAWLQDFDITKVDKSTASTVLHSLLQSRLVYYPGSGRDGGPVAVFNSAHAAHCFMYVDYQLTRDNLLRELEDAAFRGYTTVARVDLVERDFNLGAWKSHVSRRVDYRFPRASPYGFIEILERDSALDDAHGAKRLAILFLAADGHAAYDAIFCQSNGTPAPFCVVLQDHGFGGNYSNFGSGGHLCQIATDCHVLPQLLLIAENTKPWATHKRCTSSDGIPVRGEVMGSAAHCRYLWQRS